jgi:Ca2+/Na+ antiporter
MNDFWQSKVLPTLTHPVLALHGILFLVLNIGLIKIFTALISGRKRDLESDFRLLASELALVVFMVALVAGTMAAIYNIQAKERPEAKDDEGFKDRLQRWSNDPFFMLDAGIYGVAYLGLISIILLMVEVSGIGPVSVWSWFATQLFYVLGGVLILLAVRSLANSFGPPAPVTEPGEGSAAATTAASAKAEESSDSKSEDSDDDDDSGDSKDEGEPGPGFVDRLVSNLSTWPQQFRWGILAVTYLGLLFLVLDMWDFRNTRPNTIWNFFFFEMAIIAGAVGALLLINMFLQVASHTVNPVKAAKDATRVNRLAARFTDPGHMALMVLVVMGGIVGSWALMNIWTSRNQDVLDFWAEVTWSLHYLVPAVAFPLVMWSMWQVLTSKAARNSKTLLNDPYRLMTYTIYFIAYLGMIDFVFHAWLYKDFGPARIWGIVGEDLFNVVARVAIFVALRALLSAVVMGPNPEVLQPVTETADAEPEAESEGAS